MARGFIYVLKNANMPNLVKIGHTERSPTTRAKELSQHTGVPGSFEVVASWEVSDSVVIERRIHSALVLRRHSGEFFSYDDVQECISEILLLLQSWTEVDEFGRSLEEVKRQELLEERQKEEKRQRQLQYESNFANVTCPQSPYQSKFQKSKVCKIN